jgi:predicted phage tail protein
LIGEAIARAPRATVSGEELDRTVTGDLATAQSRFEQAAADATSFLSGLGLAIPLMTVLAAGLVLLGVAQRISEYR